MKYDNKRYFEIVSLFISIYSFKAVHEDAVENKNFFHVVDYVVFGSMLLISALIGIFFAVRSKKKASTSTEDYLMASRNMSFGECQSVLPHLKFLRSKIHRPYSFFYYKCKKDMHSICDVYAA